MRRFQREVLQNKFYTEKQRATLLKCIKSTDIRERYSKTTNEMEKEELMEHFVSMGYTREEINKKYIIKK